MEREGAHGRGPTELAEVQRGFFVAFSYSRDAEQECAGRARAFPAQAGKCPPGPASRTTP